MTLTRMQRLGYRSECDSKEYIDEQEDLFRLPLDAVRSEGVVDKGTTPSVKCNNRWLAIVQDQSEGPRGLGRSDEGGWRGGKRPD